MTTNSSADKKPALFEAYDKWLGVTAKKPATKELVEYFSQCEKFASDPTISWANKRAFLDRIGDGEDPHMKLRMFFYYMLIPVTEYVYQPSLFSFVDKWWVDGFIEHYRRLILKYDRDGLMTPAPIQEPIGEPRGTHPYK